MNQKLQEYGRHDPTDIDYEDDMETKKGLCGICFEEIKQPLLANIWYHVWSADHTPIPASIELQLFYFFMKPKRAYDHFEKSKNCKHSRWWNNILGFKPCHEGVHGSHYYLTDYISICGKVMDIRHRDPNEEVRFPKLSTLGELDCEKCLNKLEKLGVIKIGWNSQYTFSRLRTIKWLKKRITTEQTKREN